MLNRGNLLALPVSALLTATLAVATFAQEQGEGRKEEKAPDAIEFDFDGGRVEIRGIGGGFDEIMKATKEMQVIQQNYKQAVDRLIEAAKNLENADNLMAEVPKLAKLAKDADELKRKLKEKQKAMAAGAGGIRIFGGGALPIFPGGVPEEFEDE